MPIVIIGAVCAVYVFSKLGGPRRHVWDWWPLASPSQYRRR